MISRAQMLRNSLGNFIASLHLSLHLQLPQRLPCYMRCHSGREDHGFVGGCVRCARTASRENVVSLIFWPERTQRSGRWSADRPAGPACLQTSRSAPNLLNTWHITCPILAWHAVSRMPIPRCQWHGINANAIEMFRFKIYSNRPFFFSFPYRCTPRAMARWSTVLSGVFLALSMVLSLGKLLMLAAGTGSNGELTEADQWLAEIGLAKYRPLFRNKGKYRSVIRDSW